jgi:hypothetical protein
MSDWETKQDFGSGEMEIVRNNSIGKTLSAVAQIMVTMHFKRK